VTKRLKFLGIYLFGSLEGQREIKRDSPLAIVIKIPLFVGLV